MGNRQSNRQKRKSPDIDPFQIASQYRQIQRRSIANSHRMNLKLSSLRPLDYHNNPKTMIRPKRNRTVSVIPTNIPQSQIQYQPQIEPKKPFLKSTNLSSQPDNNLFGEKNEPNFESKAIFFEKQAYDSVQERRAMSKKLREVFEDKLKGEIELVELRARLNMKIEQNGFLKKEAVSLKDRLDEKITRLTETEEKLQSFRTEMSKLLSMIKDKDDAIGRLRASESTLKDTMADMETNFSQAKLQNVQLESSVGALREKSRILQSREERAIAGKGALENALKSLESREQFAERLAALQKDGALLFFPRDWRCSFDRTVRSVAGEGALWLSWSGVRDQTLFVSFSDEKDALQTEIELSREWNLLDEEKVRVRENPAKASVSVSALENGSVRVKIQKGEGEQGTGEDSLCEWFDI